MTVSASRLERHADRAAPGVGADDRTDLADDDLVGDSGRSIVDEFVDVGAVGMQHGEARIRPSYARPSRRGRRAPWTGPLLAALLDLAVDTSMIGLIASAVASSALALPIRPPFFRFSSVSSAPNTRVRRRQFAGERPMSSTSPPAAARRRTPGRSCRAPGTPCGCRRRGRRCVGDRSGGELGALHRRRQRTRQRHDDDAGRTARRSPPVRLLEPPRRRCGRRGRSGVAAIAQNSAVVSSTRSMNSSSPKRIERHDLDARARRSWGRSHALSVTMPTASCTIHGSDTLVVPRVSSSVYPAAR